MGHRQIILGPEGKEEVVIEKNTTILEVERLSGIHIHNIYGRNGVCGKCKIKIERSD